MSDLILTFMFFQHGFPDNPSQESLSLSISGSDSLHSWNLETTEELSDLIEDSDWSCLDTSVEEEKGTEGVQAVCNMGNQESKPGEAIKKQEEGQVAINGNKEEEMDDRNNFREVNAEDEGKKDSHEKTVSLGEDADIETADKPEEEESQEKREGEQKQIVEVVEDQEMEKGANEMLQSVTRQEEARENQDEESGEVTGSLNKLTKLNPHQPKTAQEQQGQEDNLNSTASPGPHSLTVDSEPQADQKTKSEAAEKVEREMRQSPSAPKVLSAVVRFKSQAHSQGFQVKSRTKELAEPGRPSNVCWSRENAKTHSPHDTSKSEENSHSEGHEEEDLPPIKVSELKKRFEA